jgi:hypothetical protein
MQVTTALFLLSLLALSSGAQAAHVKYVLVTETVVAVATNVSVVVQTVVAHPSTTLTLPIAESTVEAAALKGGSVQAPQAPAPKPAPAAYQHCSWRDKVPVFGSECYW